MKSSVTGRDFLAKITAARRARVEQARRATSLEVLRAKVKDAPEPLSMASALKLASGVALIAEMKRGSPSAGTLRADLDPAETARTYAANGAAAISVLTEPDIFGGSTEDLRQVKEVTASTGTPVLQKDFVIDEYQVWEARTNGADAILLIVAILEPAECRDLLNLVHYLGMEALVEAFSREELETALGMQAQLIGINNRNLDTLETSLKVFEELGPVARAAMPSDAVLVAESGMRTPEDVRRMAHAGADAVLVGESLMRSVGGIADLVRAMAGAG